MKQILYQFRWTMIALILISISYIFIHIESEYAANLLPNAVEYYIDDKSITFGDLHLLDGENLIVNGVCYSYGNVQGQNVRLIETDGNYPKMHTLQIQRGTFYNNDFEDVCVISSDLALKLFAKIDVVQNVIQIDEKCYTIVGVYDFDSSFLSQISSDGINEIFIPAHLSNIVEKIYISNKKGYPAISGVNELFASIRVSLSEMDSVNWFEKLDLLLQFKAISMFLSGITVSAALAFLAVIHIKKLIIKNNFANGNHMLIEKNGSVKLLTQAIILLILSVTICIIITFRLTLPYEWIPSDGNIFNVLHYKELLIEAFRLHNSNIISYYDNIYWYSMWFLSGMLLLLIIECMVLLINIIKNIKYKEIDK